MAARILLTGTPGCGKTTLVRRVVEQLRHLRLAGFITQELRSDDGKRIGFEAIGLNGGSTMLANVKSGSRIRVGKYGVELPRFEELIGSELQRPGSEVDLFVVDEVGKMECFSPLFVEQMEVLLDGSTPLLATVAIKGSGFIAQIKQRADVELLEVTSHNRDELVDKLAERLRHAIVRRWPT